jgi:hypothetical protein
METLKKVKITAPYCSTIPFLTCLKLARQSLKCGFQRNSTGGDGLHAMNLEITPTPAHDLIVQHVYCTIICSTKQLAQLSPIYVLYDSAPYNHSMVQVPYCTVISQRRQDFITQILSRSMYLEAGSSYFVAFSFNLIVQSS